MPQDILAEEYLQEIIHRIVDLLVIKDGEYTQSVKLADQVINWIKKLWLFQV